MTEPRQDDHVHQAFFGWSYEAGQLTLLDDTFGHEAAGTRWLHSLGNFLRLQRVDEAELPAQALSYFAFADGWAAVLRRVARGYSPGRNNSHALIGPASVLTVPVALGLEGWQEWRSEPPSEPMRCLDATYVTGFGVAAERRLRPLAKERERDLVAVLARLLDCPERPLSIVGCPDRYRLAVVWGLREAADGYLRRNGLTLPWTFSTHEHRHDDAIDGLPAIVFLSASPQGVGQADRTIVDLGLPETVGYHSDLAQELVRSLLHGAPAPHDERVAQVVGSRRTPPDRDWPAAAHQGGRQQHDRPPYGGTGPAVPPAAGTLPAADGDRVAVPARRTVGVLLEAKSVVAIESGLRQLEDLAKHPPTRQQLRSAMDSASVNAAVQLVEVTAREEWLGRLLQVLYGPQFEDLADASAIRHATRLVRDGQSDQVVRMLGRSARQHNAICKATFDRLTGDSSTLVPTGQLARAARSARRSRYLPVAVLAAASALLLVVFLAGYVAGRPATAAAPDQPVTPPPVTTTAPQPPPHVPVDPTGGSASVPERGQATLTVAPREDQIVFGFIKRGDQYFPQAECTHVRDLVWKCLKSEPVTGSQGATSSPMVAVVLPDNQLQELLDAAKIQRSTLRGDDWGDEVGVS